MARILDLRDCGWDLVIDLAAVVYVAGVEDKEEDGQVYYSLMFIIGGERRYVVSDSVEKLTLVAEVLRAHILDRGEVLRLQPP